MLDEAMEKGDYEKYATLCTHPYTIVGKIGHGKKLGRTVGMPTANLDFESIKKIYGHDKYWETPFCRR